MDASAEPHFPPLFQGLRITGSLDPFAKASAMAALGCEAGTVTYNLAADRMSASMILAPEVPLEEAMTMLPVCGVGLQNALGALAPPEVSMHLGWTGEIYVNGASCGQFRTNSSTNDPGQCPDWLIVGFMLQIIPVNRDAPGVNPEQTSLYEEGCVEVSPVSLLESWSRHTLVWINRWIEDGAMAVHREWKGLVRDMGEEIAISWQGKLLEGTFLGVDERFGMLLRQERETRLLPLSGLLINAGK